MTPREAVEFFARKIEDEATRENRRLTDSEKQTLRFSEVEADEWNDGKLPSLLEDEAKADEYENRMGDLLVIAYQREISNPIACATWEKAKAALIDHGYYIWATLWRVFPETKPHLTGDGKPGSLTDYLIYVLVGVAVVVVVVYVALRSA